MSGTREPTELGWYLLQKMGDKNLSQAEFARRCGVSESTVSRWIYSPGRPDTDKLAAVAVVLDADTAELLTRAGYGTAPATSVNLEVTPLPAIVAELRILLGPVSPVPPDLRPALEAALDAVVTPYRQYLHRRRRTG